MIRNVEKEVSRMCFFLAVEINASTPCRSQCSLAIMPRKSYVSLRKGRGLVPTTKLAILHSHTNLQLWVQEHLRQARMLNRSIPWDSSLSIRRSTSFSSSSFSRCAWCFPPASHGPNSTNSSSLDWISKEW